MIKWLKQYKGFFIGLIVTCILIEVLVAIDFILIDKSEVAVNILLFLFWWIIISLPFHFSGYLKKKKKIVFRIIGLISLLVFTLWIDSYLSIPDNPISIFLIITFWMGLLYLLAPIFFSKYRLYILTLYIFLFSYWTYVRLFSENFEHYLKFEKGFAFTLLVLPIPIFFILWGYEQWKWLKSLKADKAAAELALLKTQINPHFFFNTLNNLYSLTVKHSDEAPKVILMLSDMMRYTIYEGKKSFVPIQEEIKYLNNYIDLHRIRYHKKVNINFEHDVGDDDQIAPLLFIILLENAIKHGVESLSDGAYIKMNLVSNGKTMHFCIQNNFDPTIKSEECGIGLENLKRRLALIYPEEYKLTVTERNNTFKVDLNINIK
ncbi:sensor histidine kinase [Fulvivirga sp. 29W222]|uniref:Sensor histidine kinase n=1 Tax=Fulvivirga marina TaxID=2494733 RepID=A0A937FZF7_9BACT|nr:histidine kinase [Fulvivirga marina]MBL6448844.1 sensor histidine kinase [Fulvivirga marina]